MSVGVSLGYKSLYQIQGNTPLGYMAAQVCCKNRVTNSKFISWTITLIGKLVERTPPKTRRFFRLTFKKNPTNPWNIPQVSQRSKNEGFLRVRGILVDLTAFNNPQVPGWTWRKCTPRGVVRSQSWFHHGRPARRPSQLNDRMVPSPLNLLNEMNQRF